MVLGLISFLFVEQVAEIKLKIEYNSQGFIVSFLINFLCRRAREDSLPPSCSHTGSVGAPHPRRHGAVPRTKDKELLPWAATEVSQLVTERYWGSGADGVTLSLPLLIPNSFFGTSINPLKKKRKEKKNKYICLRYIGLGF